MVSELNVSYKYILEGQKLSNSRPSSKAFDSFFQTPKNSVSWRKFSTVVEKNQVGKMKLSDMHSTATLAFFMTSEKFFFPKTISFNLRKKTNFVCFEKIETHIVSNFLSCSTIFR